MELQIPWASMEGEGRRKEGREIGGWGERGRDRGKGLQQLLGVRSRAT